jgi:hypothetical protein
MDAPDFCNPIVQSFPRRNIIPISMPRQLRYRLSAKPFSYELHTMACLRTLKAVQKLFYDDAEIQEILPSHALLSDAEPPTLVKFFLRGVPLT